MSLARRSFSITLFLIIILRLLHILRILLLVIIIMIVIIILILLLLLLFTRLFRHFPGRRYRLLLAPRPPTNHRPS